MVRVSKVLSLRRRMILRISLHKATQQIDDQLISASQARRFRNTPRYLRATGDTNVSDALAKIYKDVESMHIFSDNSSWYGALVIKERCVTLI